MFANAVLVFAEATFKNCVCVQQNLLITCRTIIHVEKDHGKEESEEGKEIEAHAIVLYLGSLISKITELSS